MTERSLSEMPGGAPLDAADPVVVRITELAQARATEPGPLLEILHDIQHEFGYLPEPTTAAVAEVLNLSRAEVHGVITFYSDFRTTPPAEVAVAICRGEACQSVGAEKLVEHASRSLGVEVGSTSADGTVGLQQVFCFGNCALGPTVSVAGRLRGRVTEASFDALVADARRGAQQ
ncbi:MAG TPA: NAD(P)H-dependent oxidoreductase subunit E [Actinomycetes bacterium]|nr:NAD(P)H-dependent oxidoreductase subunit E [Actinomycetes bacterium]